jgi:hypothetical protein
MTTTSSQRHYQGCHAESIFPSAGHKAEVALILHQTLLATKKEPQRKNKIMIGFSV